MKIKDKLAATAQMVAEHIPMGLDLSLAFPERLFWFERNESWSRLKQLFYIQGEKEILTKEALGPFTIFLVTRWNRIRKFKALSYFYNYQDPLTLVCESLADEMQMGHRYEKLMYTVSFYNDNLDMGIAQLDEQTAEFNLRQSYLNAGASLVDAKQKPLILEQDIENAVNAQLSPEQVIEAKRVAARLTNLERAQLRNFVLDLNGSIISVNDCISDAQYDGVLKHTNLLEQGLSFALKAQEKVKVIYHSKEAKAYYDAVMVLAHKRQTSYSIGSHLYRLIDALQNTGVDGSGTELTVNLDLTASVDDFYQFLKHLEPAYLARLFTMGSGDGLHKSFRFYWYQILQGFPMLLSETELTDVNSFLHECKQTFWREELERRRVYVDTYYSEVVEESVPEYEVSDDDYSGSSDSDSSSNSDTEMDVESEEFLPEINDYEIIYPSVPTNDVNVHLDEEASPATESDEEFINRMMDIEPAIELLPPLEQDPDPLPSFPAVTDVTSPLSETPCINIISGDFEEMLNDNIDLYHIMPEYYRPYETGTSIVDAEEMRTLAANAFQSAMLHNKLTHFSANELRKIPYASQSLAYDNDFIQKLSNDLVYDTSSLARLLDITPFDLQWWMLTVCLKDCMKFFTKGTEDMLILLKNNNEGQQLRILKAIKKLFGEEHLRLTTHSYDQMCCLLYAATTPRVKKIILKNLGKKYLQAHINQPHYLSHLQSMLTPAIFQSCIVDALGQQHLEGLNPQIRRPEFIPVSPNKLGIVAQLNKLPGSPLLFGRAEDAKAKRKLSLRCDEDLADLPPAIRRRLE